MFRPSRLSRLRQSLKLELRLVLRSRLRKARNSKGNRSTFKDRNKFRRKNWRETNVKQKTHRELKMNRIVWGLNSSRKLRQNQLPSILQSQIIPQSQSHRPPVLKSRIGFILRCTKGILRANLPLLKTRKRIPRKRIFQRKK